MDLIIQMAALKPEVPYQIRKDLAEFNHWESYTETETQVETAT